MRNYRQEYIENHSLEFDIQNSECRSCTLHECGYYYGECPNDFRPSKTIVTNAYSGSMVRYDKYSTDVEKISEEEFAMNAKQAFSHIGNKFIANRYGLRLNKKPIKLLPGDEVYVVYIHGGRLPEHGKLPKDVKLSFEHVTIKAVEA